MQQVYIFNLFVVTDICFMISFLLLNCLLFKSISITKITKVDMFVVLYFVEEVVLIIIEFDVSPFHFLILRKAQY